jgi:hypothetical protein
MFIHLKSSSDAKSNESYNVPHLRFPKKDVIIKLEACGVLFMGVNAAESL